MVSQEHNGEKYKVVVYDPFEGNYVLLYTNWYFWAWLRANLIVMVHQWAEAVIYKSTE